MTSKKKRKYGDLTDQTASNNDPEIFADVFAAFTGRRPPMRVPEAVEGNETEQITPAPHATPASRATPAPRTTPARSAAPAQKEPEPLHRAAAAPRATPAQQTTVAGFTRVPNDLLDRIIPTLDTYDQSVLIRLYRLARGFNSDTCRVSVPTLAKACNISERQTRKSIVRLERRELIQRIEQDFGNKNMALRGTTFKVLISEAAVARRAAPEQQTTPAQYAAPARGAANKVNTQKESTQTHVGVGGRSRFSLNECRKYAEHLRSTGQGINNPGGYATTILRTGEADDAIAAFLTPEENVAPMDVSGCPDCSGTGFWYPNGLEKGVKRCMHARLIKEE
jgi:DNA-binding Lrp family transcriptional regulator